MNKKKLNIDAIKLPPTDSDMKLTERVERLEELIPQIIKAVSLDLQD